MIVKIKIFVFLILGTFLLAQCGSENERPAPVILNLDKKIKVYIPNFLVSDSDIFKDDLATKNDLANKARAKFIETLKNSQGFVLITDEDLVGVKPLYPKKDEKNTSKSNPKLSDIDGTTSPDDTDDIGAFDDGLGNIEDAGTGNENPIVDNDEGDAIGDPLLGDDNKKDNPKDIDKKKNSKKKDSKKKKNKIKKDKKEDNNIDENIDTESDPLLGDVLNDDDFSNGIDDPTFTTDKNNKNTDKPADKKDKNKNKNKDKDKSINNNKDKDNDASLSGDIDPILGRTFGEGDMILDDSEEGILSKSDEDQTSYKLLRIGCDNIIYGNVSIQKKMRSDGNLFYWIESKISVENVTDSKQIYKDNAYMTFGKDMTLNNSGPKQSEKELVSFKNFLHYLSISVEEVANHYLRYIKASIKK